MVIKLGAIGTGNGLAALELEQYAEMNDVEVVAGADIAQPARDTFTLEHGGPIYESHQTLLEEHGDELDAINIVTPHTLHYEMVRASLEHDINVFVEKPLVTNIEDGIDLVQLADAADLVLQVGYQRHFHPAFIEIKRLIDNGRIGEPHMVNTYLGQNWIEPFVGKWRTNPELSGGGQLYDSGSHLLDSLLWTTSTEPISVAAAIDYRDHKVDVNSAISAILARKDSGESVTASIAVTGDGLAGLPEETLVIWGRKGKISYSQEQGEHIRVVEKDGREYVSEITENVTQPSLTKLKIRNFIDAIQGKCEPAVSGEFGVDVTALTEAAYEAFESGTTVNVQDRLEAARQPKPLQTD